MLYSQQKSHAVIRIVDAMHHIEESRVTVISENDKTEMSRACETRLSPFQILSQVRSTAKNPVLYQDVCNIWVKVMSTKFRRHDDPCESAFIYINESETLHNMCIQNSPFGIGFYTNDGKRVLH